MQFEGAICHVFNRGIDRRELSWDAKDGEVFLGSLEGGVERFHVSVYAYTTGAAVSIQRGNLAVSRRRDGLCLLRLFAAHPQSESGSRQDAQGNALFTMWVGIHTL
jgi:hypothetical protein